MKAMAIDDFGAEPTPHELPVPQAADGELLVQVQASSVNGFDLSVQSGVIKGMMEYRFPIVLGRDFAGPVTAVGPGVSGFETGDLAFGVLIKMILADGTFAEHAAVPASSAAKIPDGLPVQVAGALGLAGTAALAAIDAIAPAPGETVLVAGATGGVGAFAVQLAKARGASVIATASTDQDDRIRGLGADETVDRAGDVAAAVLALRPDGVHAVVHAAGDALQLSGLLIPGGRIASLLGAGPDQLGGRDVQATPVAAQPTREKLEQLAAAVAGGDLTVPIERTYHLPEVSRALDDFRAGKRGKLGILIP